MIGRYVPLCLTLWLLSGSAVLAQQAVAGQPEILSVEVGLGGHYRVGAWTPVSVTLRGGDQPVRGQVILTVPDSDGVPSRMATPADEPVDLTPGQTASVAMFVRFGRIESQMDVEFRAEEKLLVSRIFRASATPGEGRYPLATPSNHRLVAVLGAGPAGVEQAADLLKQQPGEHPLVVPLETTDSLPKRWYGYESFDALVIVTSKPELVAGLKPEGPEIIALDKWLRMGGKLVLSVGSQGEKILADGAPLARFRPGQLQRMVPLPQTGSLEAYAGNSVPVPHGPDGKLHLPVPQLGNAWGTVEAREGNVPLVIRRAWGLGQVVFFAADLDTAPLADWPSRGHLVSRLLDWPASSSGELDERSAMMHYGFTDMSGQLRSALDQHPGVWPVPFSLVAGVIILYVLLIGPVDYFLLRKLSPRMELTWLTFPILVIGFSLAAYVLSHRFKGEEVRANQVSLVDVDTEWKWLRGTSWSNVFSPRMDHYDLSCLPVAREKRDGRVGETLFAWLGLPGSAMGGMDLTTANPVQLRQPYEYAPELDALRGVPIQVWASKSFTSRWNSPADVYPEASLIDQDQVLTGKIVNTLDFALNDCLLVYGRWAYELGTLEPGQMAPVGAMSRRRELAAFLTGRRIVFADKGNKSQQESDPYDQSNVDPAYILRIMMFFDAVGGRAYTGLANRYQDFVDLSGLLKTNRAILVATAPTDSSEGARHGSDLLRDGQPLAGPKDRQLTIYRFIYPVDKPK